MARIEWNREGERLFETGVDQCVFYPKFQPGVPWNGVVSIQEGFEGGEIEPLHFEGVKRADITTSEDFTATLTAINAPDEFESSDGRLSVIPGFTVTHQPRAPFGLSYRTLIGNDQFGERYAYKLHLVYNATAEPTTQNYTTVTEVGEPSSRSWTLHTVPPISGYFKPTAHVILDSRYADQSALMAVEDTLYGNPASPPRLPGIEEIFSALAPPVT